MDCVFELALQLPPKGSGDLLHALHRQLRAAIEDGRLKPGLRLPPTRTLAAAHGLARNTVVAAYDLLLSEGYLLARRGAGTFVAGVRPRPAVRDGRGPQAVLNPFWRDVPRPLEISPRNTLRHDFRLGVPDAKQFPFEVWRRLSARAWRAASKSPLSYADPQGQQILREAIAKHVSFARAVACHARDILVTCGAQQGFDLLARVLITPGTVVAVEDPGYPPARLAFAAAGARIEPVPVDSEGLCVDRLPTQAKVICVTASHQFPLGSVMSARRRDALLAFARTNAAIIVEDDYDSEFRYDGQPLEALQTLDRGGAVFYVGTFSKCLFPALRLGFVVAPPWAQRALVAAKQAMDWHCEITAQETLATFIGEGHLARHVRKMRHVYGERRSVLLAGLRQHFGEWLEPVPSAAGLHLSVLPTVPVDVEELALRAGEHGIGVYSLRRFQAAEATLSGLVFGYGSIEERAIPKALGRLRQAWRRTAAPSSDG